LGTDFKVGQTKFKTAAVKYLRAMGLTPRIINSSNHLGSNDMRNLASTKAASDAKRKVKHDIFAPWQEDQLDHKVSIMYTPFINDDKRDDPASSLLFSSVQRNKIVGLVMYITYKVLDLHEKESRTAT
jgi:myo-inositol-1-phosphate synthase